MLFYPWKKFHFIYKFRYKSGELEYFLQCYGGFGSFCFETIRNHHFGSGTISRIGRGVSLSFLFSQGNKVYTSWELDLFSMIFFWPLYRLWFLREIKFIKVENLTFLAMLCWFSSLFIDSVLSVKKCYKETFFREKKFGIKCSFIYKFSYKSWELDHFGCVILVFGPLSRFCFLREKSL